jgi:gliding motility-associated-like protein
MQYKSIMKKHIKLVTSILLLFTSVSLSAATDGSNIDFSQGFAGWKRYHGTFKCDNPTAPDNDKTYSYSWSEVNSTDRITFITEYNTLDPIIRCSDHYLYTNPDPGKVVARLGVPKKTEGYSGGGGAATEKLEYEFDITDATSILKYRFAAVLQVPGGGNHEGDEFPYFGVNVRVVNISDGTEAVIPCSSYRTIATKAGSNVQQANTCAASSAAGNYVYRSWTSILVDMRDYADKNYKAVISVITRDCLFRSGGMPYAGSHEAYGYFRAEFMDNELSTLVCNEDDAKIAAPEGYAKYAWSRSNHFNIPVASDQQREVTIPAAEMVPGVEYYCTVTDELGCSAIDLKTKLDPVSLKPSFEYTTNCDGMVEFKSTSEVSGDKIYKVIWDAGEDIVSGEVSSHKYTKPGDYNVKLTTITTNGCEESVSQKITVPYFPDLVINSEPNVCNKKDFEVSVENVEIDSDVKWYMEDLKTGESEFVSGDYSFITNLSTSKRIRVKVTDPHGCEYTTSKITNVFDPTNIYITSPKQIVCPNDKVTLTLHSNNLKSFSWNVPNNDGVNSIEVSPTEPTIYHVTAEDNNGCFVEADYKLETYEVPNLTADAPIICVGEDAKIKASGAQSYEWDYPSLTGANGAEVVIKNLQQSIEDIKVIGYNEYGCSSTLLVDVNVKDIPIITVEGDKIRCFDSEPFSLVAHGADTYVWNNTEESPTFTAVSDRNHTVTVVGKVGGCESEPLTIDLTTLPKPSIEAIQESVTICQGETATLEVTGAEGFKWFDDSQNSTLVVAPTTNTTYTVRGVSADGCLSDELSIPVIVNETGAVTLHVEKSIACPNMPDSAVVMATGALTYKWSSVPEMEVVTNNMSDRLNIAYENPVTVFVEGTNEFGCKSKTQIGLVLLEDPTFEFKVEPLWVDVENPDVRFKGLTPHNNAEWFWNVGDGTALLQARDTIHTYAVDNYSKPFKIEVTAIDPNGCTFTGETEVNIWKEVWAPTAFTPNGDGLNDEFKFYRTEFIEEFNFYIYNRLGEIVFEGHSPTDTWDGYYDGKPCPWGVYGWVADYKANLDGTLREATIKGQVSIIK